MHGGWSDKDVGTGDEPGAVPVSPADPAPTCGPGAAAGSVARELPLVLAAFQQMEALAEQVLGASMWQNPNEDSITAVKASAVVLRKVQAAHLAAIGDMHSRAGTLPGGPAGYETRTLLRHELHRTTGQAKADIEAAMRLKPGAAGGAAAPGGAQTGSADAPADASQGGLPRLGAAFSAGETSREHVDAAIRAVSRLPKALLSAPILNPDGTPMLDEQGDPMCAGDVIDEKLTAHAKEHDSHALSELAKELQDTLDPDGKFDPKKCLKRGLRLHWDYEGMLVLRGELGPADGALLMALIDQYAAPKRVPVEGEDDEGQPTLLNVSDNRGTEERQADALMEIARIAQASAGSGTRGGEPPRITLITRPEDLAAAHAAEDAANGCEDAANGREDAANGRDSADRSKGGRAFFRPAPSTAPFAGDGAYLGTGTHISPRLLALLSCDSVVQRALLAPSGAILDLGREVRTITPAQRRALTARDRGCVIPGCSVPAARCHGHHAQWWSDGGGTDIGNLLLLCPRHHTEVHARTWVVALKHGVPWVIPPDWIDPEQKPARNRYFDQMQEMRDLGTQLRLGVTIDDDGPPSSSM